MSVESAVATSSPRRTKQLFESRASSPIAFRDKAIMAFLKRRATSKDQTQFLDRLHLEFWPGEGGGVLEYFSRERLDELLTHVRENLQPAIFFASEPLMTITIGADKKFSTVR